MATAQKAAATAPPKSGVETTLRGDSVACMTRKRGMVATAIAALALLGAMAPADQRMQDTGGPGIVTFELTGGQDRADEILAEWGNDGRDAARESLWIDFGFLLAYGTFLTFALAATRDLARERGWDRLTAIGRVVIPFGALVAAFDALENICLLLTLDGAGAAFPLLATVFAACKFVLLAAVIAYLIAGLAMRLRRLRDISDEPGHEEAQPSLTKQH
jgi:hypothetical protein